MLRVFLLVMAFALCPAVGLGLGSVTPTLVTVTFTKIQLESVDGSNVTIAEGRFPVTYRKSDDGLVEIPIDTISVGAGRYRGSFVCYDPKIGVLIDGEPYQGRNETFFSHGDLIWTSGDGLANDAGSIVSAMPAGGATTLDFVRDEPGEPCIETVFTKPVCLSESSSDCEDGDEHINPMIESPEINILVDLYHLVDVNGDAAQLDGVHIDPFGMFGRPGASFHLTYVVPQSYGADIGNVGLLFDGTRSLVWGYAEPPTAAVPRPPPCPGYPYANNVTARTDGGYFDPAGAHVLVAADVTGTGVAQVLASVCEECEGGVYTGGVNVITDFIQEVGNTASITCVADEDATPPYLGYTYSPTGIGMDGTVTYEIKRISDPTNLFGVCTTGTCGSY